MSSGRPHGLIARQAQQPPPRPVRLAELSRDNDNGKRPDSSLELAPTPCPTLIAELLAQELQCDLVFSAQAAYASHRTPLLTRRRLRHLNIWNTPPKRPPRDASGRGRIGCACDDC